MLREKIRIILSLSIALATVLYIRESVFVGNTPRLNPLFATRWLENIQSSPTPTTTSQTVPTIPFETSSSTTYPSLPPTIIYTRSPTPTIRPTIPLPTRAPTAKPQPTSQSSASSSCPSSSGETYQTISINSPPTDRPAEQHADLNIQMRGYEKTSGVYGLIDVGGDTDDRAPQLSTLVPGASLPSIIGLYQIYIWDWSKNSRGPISPDPEVTLIGVKTSPGQNLVAPRSGYDIGGGYQVMALYANESTVTLKYTREDNVVFGYTIHADRICTDPNLLSLYRSMNDQGRSSLPALRAGQTFGYAKTGETIIAIRDTGTFMDPRVRKDWWKGY